MSKSNTCSLVLILWLIFGKVSCDFLRRFCRVCVSGNLVLFEHHVNSLSRHLTCMKSQLADCYMIQGLRMRNLRTDHYRNKFFKSTLLRFRAQLKIYAVCIYTYILLYYYIYIFYIYTFIYEDVYIYIYYILYLIIYYYVLCKFLHYEIIYYNIY